MTTLRSYIDPDLQETNDSTSFMTEQNDREVFCDMCARTVYVDDETFRFVSEAIEFGLDNPFCCEECEEEFDDLAFED